MPSLPHHFASLPREGPRVLNQGCKAQDRRVTAGPAEKLHKAGVLSAEGLNAVRGHR
jgi:hypothetical protein